jgi:hypothetical protein
VGAEAGEFEVVLMGNALEKNQGVAWATDVGAL